MNVACIIVKLPTSPLSVCKQYLIKNKYTWHFTWYATFNKHKYYTKMIFFKSVNIR